MPRNLSKKTLSANLDISLANIAQLTRLPAERLRQHLSTRHLVTTGNKATMARRLYQAIHQPPITQIPTSDSTYLLRQQLSPPPSLPDPKRSNHLRRQQRCIPSPHCSSLSHFNQRNNLRRFHLRSSPSHRWQSHLQHRYSYHHAPCQCSYLSHR